MFRHSFPINQSIYFHCRYLGSFINRCLTFTSRKGSKIHVFFCGKWKEFCLSYFYSLQPRLRDIFLSGKSIADPRHKSEAIPSDFCSVFSLCGGCCCNFGCKLAPFSVANQCPVKPMWFPWFSNLHGFPLGYNVMHVDTAPKST